MTDKIARECDYCHKADIIIWNADSNGMVMIHGDHCWLLLMRDLRERESGRPTFTLTNKSFHPKCLIRAIEDWLREVE